MTARCDLTDLPTDMCAHCLGHRSDTDDRATARAHLIEYTPGWIEARFPGLCAVCDERYPAGTAITRHNAGWVADCCAAEVAQ